MSGALLGVLALLLILGGGALVSAALRREGLVATALTIYVVGWTVIVALSLLLSASRALTQGALVAGAVVFFVLALGMWGLVGAPRPALARISGIGAPASAALAVVVALAFAYVLALIFGTPPNGWDPLNYHLARVAFWLQSHRIGYIEPTYDERLDLNPPNAEIGAAFALGVTHNELFVGLVQYFAALASSAAVFGLGRRVGLTVPEGVFGALLFLSLPIVALQASLAKNDLVVASLLLAAAYFVLGNTRRDLGLALLATALAVGTKTTALYGIVVLVVLALVAQPRAWRTLRLLWVLGGAAIGCYWYVVNIVETGHFFGDQSAQQGVTAVLQARADVVTALGTAVDVLDLSGGRGKDILIYVIAAAAVAALLARRGPRRGLIVLGLGAAPLLLLVVSEHVGRPALVHLYSALNSPRGYIAVGSAAASPTIASDTASWFGPLGVLLVTGTAAVLASAKARAAVPRLVWVLALAPLGWFVLVALTLSYNPFLGRFFVFPVALSAALWGRVLRWPALAVAATVLATVTVGLSLVHYAEKPSGLRLLDRAPTASVWDMPRWQVQSQHDPALAPALQFVDERVAPRASMALALSDNGFGYPVFGAHLERHVVLVPMGSNAHDVRTDWLFASRDRAPQIDSSCWTPELQSAEGSIFKRSASCA